ncbi:MAG TPA: HNH endonuclease signature motif containing protein [Blastocatellia bacterium]|nr:HNH endonuclease signature motif containing protein [Blastocatellia bacterium]
MTKRNVPPDLRRLVVERARNYCEYCRYPGRYASQTLSVDHINPRDAGGRTIPENLALSCQGCNGHKAARTSVTDPITGALVVLFNPREQEWDEHFAWSEDSLRITGLTPIGRATVNALQLNREGLVNMRRVLYAIGKHPPPETE